MSFDIEAPCRGWNYSNANKDFYEENLIGTFVAIQEVQRRQFNPNGQPGPGLTYPDGNPIMDIRITLYTEKGEFVYFQFKKASRKAVRENDPNSTHLKLSKFANGHIKDLLGRTMMISTVPGNYGLGNPRPFEFAMAPEGYGPFQPTVEVPAFLSTPVLYADDPLNGGQAMQPVMQQQQQQQQPQYQMQQMPYQQAQVQFQQQQPVQQQMPMQQQFVPQQQAVQQPMPQAMNPAVANAMQQLGATNVQEVAEEDLTGEVYSDIPF